MFSVQVFFGTNFTKLVKDFIHTQEPIYLIMKIRQLSIIFNTMTFIILSFFQVVRYSIIQFNPCKQRTLLLTLHCRLPRHLRPPRLSSLHDSQRTVYLQVRALSNQTHHPSRHHLVDNQQDDTLQNRYRQLVSPITINPYPAGTESNQTLPPVQSQANLNIRAV